MCLTTEAPDRVDLYWLPLGAGGALGVVRISGRIYEAIVSLPEHRDRLDLYHSALEVNLDGDRYVIESAPVWGNKDRDRGVVGEGPVGSPPLGRSRFFRYEVRRWRHGVIPDLAEAVATPRRVSEDGAHARQLLDLVPDFPTATWGRDELGTGEMWNSNSLISWLLARSGHDISDIAPPARGRAPGWHAGVIVARRTATEETSITAPKTGRAGQTSHVLARVRRLCVGRQPGHGSREDHREDQHLHDVEEARRTGPGRDLR